MLLQKISIVTDYSPPFYLASMKNCKKPLQKEKRVLFFLGTGEREERDKDGFTPKEEERKLFQLLREEKASQSTRPSG